MGLPDAVSRPLPLFLNVVSAPAFSADFDLDGDVDGEHLNDWRGDFGMNADNDGEADGADFLEWGQQLGSQQATPASGAVPEPGAALLAMVAMPACRRRLAM